MSLNFPNPSHSFDAENNRVLFWGYDSTIEVSFFVETAALKRLCPQMSNTETEIIQAFNTARKRIYEVANKLYTRGDQGIYSYLLSASDF